MSQTAKSTLRLWLALALLWAMATTPALAQERSVTSPTAVQRDAVNTGFSEGQRSLPPPFGSNLFQPGQQAGAAGIDPNYRVSLGDQVAIRVWGAITIDQVVTVDPQGNVFVPEVGPIRVQGIRSADLNSYIADQINEVYTENVEVYATLVDARTIGVFVTGFVDRPGRLLGTSTESVLDYLTKAGGVDIIRGSYRDIRVVRGNTQIAAVDLYQFLLYGRLPQIQFREGDTIIVGPQRAMISADGTVRNTFRFEFGGAFMSGAQAVELARPLPSTTHVQVNGVRNGDPYSDYLTLDEFATALLQDQDLVVFEADRRSKTVTVDVVGAHLGPSVFVADQGTALRDLLDYIAVDPELADTTAIHLRRQSVARQQKQSLDDALDRLERSVLTAVAESTGDASIRTAEAELVAQYIERARTTNPQGVVVLARTDGTISNIRLEDGDEIVLPQRSEVVVIGGEVIAPQAVVFDSALTADDYVDLAGGYTRRGDTSTYIVRRVNGRVDVASNPIIRPGDEIIIPPEVDFKELQIGADIIDVLFKIVVGTAVFFR